MTTYRGVAVNGEPDAFQRRCFDCKHCVGHISWWCNSEAATKARGTKIPGIRNCTYWEPIPTMEELLDKRSWLGKLFNTPLSSYYIEIDCSKNNKEEK